ncbi:GTPase Era [Oleispirillum naphthae]|uniref:GTPase Era n=1 Tax=Oleispirillum naphthae TaxID=2838853 RepID=UPI0030822FF0
MTKDSLASRCGFVAVLGAPNAGKSTLVNAAVGGKVSIVTHKVQTTRARVRGIMQHGDTQIAFVDTPGIFAPRRRLDRAMVAAAWSEAQEADVVMLLIDAHRGLTSDVRAILARLAEPRPRKLFLVLNKIDLVRRDALLGLAQQVNDTLAFDRTFMVAAAGGDGVADILDAVAAEMPAGPWLFDPEHLSDMPNRLLAAEITREQVFLQLHQELPYAMTVETESWEDKEDGSVRIEQTIYVQRDGQKSIVLGKGGTRIKGIGAAARKELEALLETRVHLFLFVKVRDNWLDDPERYRDWGLDFNA